MLPNAVIGYHNVQGSINRHKARVPPHSHLLIDVYKLFPTPPGTLHFVLPTEQHQFVLNLATFLVCDPKSCSWVPYYPRLNTQPWHQVSPHSNLTMDREKVLQHLLRSHILSKQWYNIISCCGLLPF